MALVPTVVAMTPIICENSMIIPLDITSLTGYVSSIEKLYPTGMIGRMKKPKSAIFILKRTKFLDGIVIKTKEAKRSVPKHIILRILRYA